MKAKTKTLLILIFMVSLTNCNLSEEECVDWYVYKYETKTSFDGSSTTFEPQYRCRKYE